MLNLCQVVTKTRDGSRAAATSKMERFVIIVNGFQPLTIITKPSILDVAAALDLPSTISEQKKTCANESHEKETTEAVVRRYSSK